MRKSWRAKGVCHGISILSFSLSGSLRRLKPQRPGYHLARRADPDLAFVTMATGPGPALLLDTSVYIDVLQGQTPPEVDDLLGLRILNHSSVVLAELTHLFGRLDPSHPDTRAALRDLGGTLNDIPPHRLTAPSIRASGEAGMLAGLAARLTSRVHGPELLNDALMLLHAEETGRILLTRNIEDFDYLQQLAPTTRILLYRQV